MKFVYIVLIIGAVFCIINISKNANELFITKELSKSIGKSVEEIMYEVVCNITKAVADEYELKHSEINVGNIKFKDGFTKDGYDKWEITCKSKVTFEKDDNLQKLIVTYKGLPEEFKSETCKIEICDLSK